jgi:hypothetical protein
VIVVEFGTENVVAAFAPNFTDVAPVKFVPVIVTLVPPDVGPLLGFTFVTAGAATYVNWSAADGPLVPPGVVTVTSTVPALPAGDVAVIVVPFVTENVVAAFAPNFTAVAPVKFVPVIVTLVPPAVEP